MIRSVVRITLVFPAALLALATLAARADEDRPKLTNQTARLSRAIARAVEKKGASITLRTPLTLVNIGTVGPRKLRVRSLRSTIQPRKLSDESKIVVVSGDARNKKGNIVGTLRLVRGKDGSVVGAIALGVKNGDLSAFYKITTDTSNLSTTIEQQSKPNTLASSGITGPAFLKDLKPYSVIRIATDMSCEMYGPRGHNFSSVADANDFVTTVISMAEAIYARQLNVIFDIVYQHTWTSCQGDPYVAAQGGELVLEPDRLLIAMSNEWDANFVPVVPKFDTAALFTSLLSSQIDAISGGSKVTLRANHKVGASLGVSCQGGAYISVTSDYAADNSADGSQRSENVFYFMKTFAHEMGHNLASDHDTSCIPGYIMCPTGSNVDGFSPSSISTISNYITTTRNAVPGCFQVRNSEVGNSPVFSRTSPMEIRNISEGETIRLQFTPPLDKDNDVVRIYLSPPVAGATIEGNAIIYTASKPFSSSCSNRNVSMTLVAEDSRGNRGSMDLTVYVRVPVAPEVWLNKSLYTGAAGAAIPFSVVKNASTFPLDETGLGAFTVGGTTADGRYFLLGPDPAVQVSLDKVSGQGSVTASPGLYMVTVRVSDCTRSSSNTSSSFLVLPTSGGPGLYLDSATGTIETNLYPFNDKLNSVNRLVEMRRGEVLSQKFLVAGPSASSRLKIEVVGSPPSGLTVSSDGFEFRPTQGSFPQSCSSDTSLSPSFEVPITFRAVDLDTNLTSNQVTARIRVYPGSIPPTLKRPTETVVGVSIPGTQTTSINLTDYFQDPDGDPMTFEVTNTSVFSISGNSIRIDAKKHKGLSAVVVAKDCNGKRSQPIEFKVGGSATTPPRSCKSPLTTSFSKTSTGVQVKVVSKKIRGDSYSCTGNVSFTSSGVTKSVSDFTLLAGRTKRVRVKIKKKGKVAVTSSCLLSCGSPQGKASYTFQPSNSSRR